MVTGTFTCLVSLVNGTPSSFGLGQLLLTCLHAEVMCSSSGSASSLSHEQLAELDAATMNVANTVQFPICLAASATLLKLSPAAAGQHKPNRLACLMIP